MMLCIHGCGPECDRCKALDIPEVEELEAEYQLKLQAIRTERDALAAQNARLRAAANILFAYGEDNEITQDPWWAVVRRNGMGENSILAAPFFSREAAERHRKAREYDYGKKSIVFCFSGHWSQQYKDLRQAMREALALTPPATLEELRRRERSVGAEEELRRLATVADGNWAADELSDRADQIRDAREKGARSDAETA